MVKITLPNNWRPRRHQRPAWIAFERGIKRFCLCWHRRAGKDDVGLHMTAVAAHPPPNNDYTNMRIGNYWHCLPQFEQARKVIWEAINPHTGKKRIDEAFPLPLRSSTRNDNMTIDFKSGSTWRLVGSDNPDSLVGAPPVGIVFSEWALSNPTAWGLLQPILLENNGWASFIFTPRGRNHARGLLEMARKNPSWFAQVLTIEDTGQISMEQIESARREYVSLFGEDAADALIQQEYWCSFEAAILGAYYGKEMARAEAEGRIGEIKPWPGVPVHTAWDLGASRGGDTMAIWFWQIVPSESGRSQVRVLAYQSGSGYSIKHYAEIIHDRLRRWRAEPRSSDSRGTDFVPHDARVPEMTSSGKDGKAKLRIEVMIEQRLRPKIVTNHHVADGISATRQLFPRVWFDEAECGNGLECLRQYQTEWDDEKKKFIDRPRSDWATHGADAFRYMAMAFRELTVRPEPERGRMLSMDPETLPPGVKGVTLEDLYRTRPGAARRV